MASAAWETGYTEVNAETLLMLMKPTADATIFVLVIAVGVILFAVSGFALNKPPMSWVRQEECYVS